MGIGASIFLMVLGAIFTFALECSIAGVDITGVGWILVIGGALGLLFAAFVGPRNRTMIMREPTEYHRGEERIDV
ncbi:DUF6458 family protein [Catellatospora tritici]|uniref:DUF6458 family protein n=1 Tax=Catellatospora tritici TaxID=2851566 RepID=UPI001C2D176A|nr:DUF6458 family protein [Catellatospora tritici]MBV1855853.1 hypothetical protein [Catellatospora tritici]